MKFKVKDIEFTVELIEKAIENWRYAGGTELAYSEELYKLQKSIKVIKSIFDYKTDLEIILEESELEAVVYWTSNK